MGWMAQHIHFNPMFLGKVPSLVELPFKSRLKSFNFNEIMYGAQFIGEKTNATQAQIMATN